ncbi:hypothetical protein [Flagellimonas flava]|uniref:hypothetical protein n=1 Tax=Flagellimonas flava TaxID=570519 RepID=UPI003D651993
MELQVLKGDTVPFRGIPIDERSRKIEHELYPFLKALLSLDDSDKNVERLPSILLMIEKSAYSMTFEQIKEAFVKYVNHELPGLTPKSNYLDGILFSSVITAYKGQLPKKSEAYKHEISEEEKSQNEYLNVIYAYDEWKQDKEVPMDYHWVYDTLKEKGLLKVSDEEKKSLNEFLRETYPGYSREKKQKKGKVMLLERFFEKLKVHIKELLV